MSSEAMPVAKCEVNSATDQASAAVGGRLAPIDGLRAVAILMVYLYHSWQFSGSPAMNAGLAGWVGSAGSLINTFPAGVDLFMVLSGFCLFWPIAKSPSSAANWSANHFAARRIRRIVPPYYASIVYVTLLPLALVLLYRAIGQPANWPMPASPINYVAHLLFLHTLFPSTWSGIQGVFWSLGLEAQFYLAFPLVVVAFRKFGLRAIAGMGAVSVLYRIGAAYWTRTSSWDVQFVASIFFLGRWMQFAAGMFAAWAVARGLPTHLKTRSAGTLLAIASVILYFFAQCFNASFLPVRDTALAIGFSVAIMALCGSRTPLRALFAHQAATALGLISYSVFLVHQTTAFYFAQFLKKSLHLEGPARFAFLATAGLGLIIAISAAFFHVFERPWLSTEPIRPRRAGRPTPLFAAQLPST